MIWESFYWKEGLLRHARDLRRREQQRRWPEASLARIEQTIMMGFYSVRKLAEARKLSDSTVGYSISVSRYPSKGEPITLMNWHKLDRLYDMDDGSHECLGLLSLCNQFIHSYVFAPVFSEGGGLYSLLFCSDRARGASLFEIELRRVIDVFELVGNDYPNQVSLRYEPDKGDYTVKARMVNELE